MESTINNHVILRCVKEGSKLRIKIVSPGYAAAANCQFPKNIRVEGREYSVPREHVIMANTKNLFFYRIKKTNITIIEKNDLKNLKVYGDEDLSQCGICFDDVDSNPQICFVIFVPCGHMMCCDKCAHDCKINGNGCCPLCRAPIVQIITKDQLQ